MLVYTTNGHAATETINPAEIDAPASEWPSTPEVDGERWTVTETADDRDDELEPDHLYNSATSPVEPSAADWEDYYAARAESHAREHLDASERLTLRQLVERQVTFYRSWQSDAGLLLADTLDELVRLLWVTGASSPAEHFARIDCLDRNYA